MSTSKNDKNTAIELAAIAKEPEIRDLIYIVRGMQVMLDLMAKMDNPDYEGFYAKGAELYAETVSPLVYPQLKTDGHPLHYLRVNVNAQMFEPFYETYGVTEGDGMYLAPDKRIAIWGESA